MLIPSIPNTPMVRINYKKKRSLKMFVDLIASQAENDVVGKLTNLHLLDFLVKWLLSKANEKHFFQVSRADLIS